MSRPTNPGPTGPRHDARRGGVPDARPGRGPWTTVIARTAEGAPLVDFATACNRAASANITLREIAQELGASPRALRRSRLHPRNRDYRPPPERWEAAIATLARYRAAELIALAEELEGRGTGRGFWR